MDLFLLLSRILALVALLLVIFLVVKRKVFNPLTTIIIALAVATCAYLIIGFSFVTVDANIRVNFGGVRIPLLLAAACIPWLLLILSQYLVTKKLNMFFAATFLLALQLGLDLFSASSINWNCQSVNCLTFPKDRFSYSGFISHTFPMLLKGLCVGLAFLLVLFNIISNRSRSQWSLNLGLIGLIAIVVSIFLLEDAVLLVFGLPIATALQAANILLVSIASWLALYFVAKQGHVQLENY